MAGSAGVGPDAQIRESLPPPPPRPQPGMRRLRVMLADDDRLIREALVDLIRDEPRAEVVGAVGSAAAAVALAVQERPDIALLDVVMPGCGVRATAGIALASPHTRVIGLSSFGDRAHSAAMTEAGAVRYLVKGDPSIDLVTTIFEVAAEGGWTIDKPCQPPADGPRAHPQAGP